MQPVLAETSLEEAFGKRRAEWINRLEIEHDHLSSLLQELLARKNTEAGLCLTCLLEELWFEARYTAEGLDWLRRFLALPTAATHTALRASGLDLAGAYALQLGDYPEARRLQEEALGIFRKCGSPVQVAYTLFHLGHLSGFVQDDYPTARDYYEDGLNILREGGHKEGIIHGMANLGTALAGMGEAVQAASLIAESLQGYYEINSLFNIELSLRRAAAVAAGLDLPETAIQLAGASEHQRLALGVSEPDVFLRAYARMLAPARRRLAEASQARLQAEGAAWSLDEAVAVALKMLLEVRDEV